MPHGVNVGVTFVENNEQRRSRDTFCQSLTVQIFPESTGHLICQQNNYFSLKQPQAIRNILCVQLHPVLQLLSDVLVLPLGQVGDDDTGVKATRVGSHPQLLNNLFLEVQETYIIILLGERGVLLFQDEKINIFLDKNQTNLAQPDFQLPGQCP